MCIYTCKKRVYVYIGMFTARVNTSEFTTAYVFSKRMTGSWFVGLFFVCCFAVL